VTDARDLRENTRALNQNTKAIVALNNTLVDIEKARRVLAASGVTFDEAAKNLKDNAGLFGVCSECMLHACVPTKITSESCACCETNHNLH
jgi:homoserine kinase